MNQKEIAARIRASAHHIPLGGTISVRGSEPISAFNFAEACARIVENAAAERDLYPRLCDQPRMAHGVNCPKKPHVGEGYLHGEDDDTPFDVDGVRYCGRCHAGL